MCSEKILHYVRASYFLEGHATRPPSSACASHTHGQNFRENQNLGYFVEKVLWSRGINHTPIHPGRAVATTRRDVSLVNISWFASLPRKPRKYYPSKITHYKKLPAIRYICTCIWSGIVPTVDIIYIHAYNNYLSSSKSTKYRVRVPPVIFLNTSLYGKTLAQSQAQSQLNTNRP